MPEPSDNATLEAIEASVRQYFGNSLIDMLVDGLALNDLAPTAIEQVEPNINLNAIPEGSVIDRPSYVLPACPECDTLSLELRQDSRTAEQYGVCRLCNGVFALKPREDGAIGM